MKPPTKAMAARWKRAGGLTELETDIMQVFWEHREASAADVREILAPARPLAQTTVITLLERMREKGILAQVKGTARPKRYRPVLEPETVVRRLLDTLQRRFFGGSTASLFAHLLASGDVDDRELEEIRRLLAHDRR